MAVWIVKGKGEFSYICSRGCIHEIREYWQLWECNCTPPIDDRTILRRYTGCSNCNHIGAIDSSQWCANCGKSINVWSDFEPYATKIRWKDG